MMELCKRYKYYSCYCLSSDLIFGTDDHDSDTKDNWEFQFCDISVYMHWAITLLTHKDQNFKKNCFAINNFQ